MLNNDFQKLSISGLITLYQLDATSLGAGILYFHGHTNYEDWLKILAYAGTEIELVGNSNNAGKEYSLDFLSKYFKWSGTELKNTGNNELVGGEYDISIKENTNKGLVTTIRFQGITYYPIAIQSDGLEMRGDGRASNPNLAMANNINGVQGAVSALCLNHSDFAGAKLTVITTLAKYLDADNFMLGNPSASDEHKKQLWFIEQKTSENIQQVTFELSNPIDFEGQRIPCREINNYCQWAINGGYRGESCGYIGAAMYDLEDKPTNNPNLDQCSGRLNACKLRFGATTPLPFGGFPASAFNDR